MRASPTSCEEHTASWAGRLTARGFAAYAIYDVAGSAGKLMLQSCSWARKAGALPLGPILIWLAGLAIGCGRSALLDERHDGEPAPIRCHTGYELVDGVCQIKEIYFAGGTFTMGRGYCYPPEEHEQDFDDSRCWLSDQSHEVTVEPFFMDAVEMVWISEETLQEIECLTMSPDCLTGIVAWFPSGHVSGANEYCGQVGKRLPTEAEWELAATAGGTRIYPWGDEAPTCERANFDEEQCGHWGVEIGRFPPSPEGLYDMAGNVAEYVLRGEDDDYTEGYPAPGFRDGDGDPNHPCSEVPCEEVIFRGGCDESEPYKLRGAHRNLSWDDDHGGFRCVRDP